MIEAMEEGEDVQLKVAVMWDGNDYYKPYKYVYIYICECIYLYRDR